jgi:hypothetical protein
VCAIIASATLPRAHATDAELAPDGPVITLRVLMSVDPLDPPIEYDNCGAVGTLQAYTGENVRWCYRITNNTDVPLTRHTLQSSQFGTIISNFPFTLQPGANAFITRMAPVGDSLVETATWRAYTPDTPDDYSDAAIGTLTVRSGIELAVTASMDPLAPPPGYDECGTQSAIPANPGRTVRWCYTVSNVSSIPRSRHSLVTTQNGALLDDFPFTLVPGASAFLTSTQVMGASAINEAATWTAFRPGPVYLSTATAAGRVLAVGDAIFIWGFDQTP